MKKYLFKTENLFLIICLFWGILFLLINPPFQAPDEPEHLFKMWGYTNGKLNFSKQNNWSGQTLPVSFINIDEYYKVFKLHKETKVPLKDLAFIAKTQLEKNKTAFHIFIPTSYTPVSYFPSFLVLWVLKILNFTPLSIIYIMRFCSLLVYLALCYYAIKITPVKKQMFLLFSAMPLCLYQAGSINTDCVCFGSMMVFFAYTFRLIFEKRTITTKQIIKFGLLVLLICILKYAYAPLVLLYFLIPKNKFEKPENYYKYFFIILLTCLVYITCFILYVNKISSNTTNIYSHLVVKKSILIKDILIHPFNYLKIVCYTTMKYGKFFFYNVISSFGCNSAMIPNLAANLYWFVLILSAMYSPDTEKTCYLTVKNKFITTSCIILIYLSVVTSVYLLFQYTPLIKGIQGRYLLPAVFLFLMLFINQKIVLKNKILTVLFFIISQIVLYLSLITLIITFY